MQKQHNLPIELTIIVCVCASESYSKVVKMIFQHLLKILPTTGWSEARLKNFPMKKSKNYFFFQSLQMAQFAKLTS